MVYIFGFYEYFVIFSMTFIQTLFLLQFRLQQRLMAAEERHEAAMAAVRAQCQREVEEAVPPVRRKGGKNPPPPPAQKKTSQKIKVCGPSQFLGTWPN